MMPTVLGAPFGSRSSAAANALHRSSSSRQVSVPISSMTAARSGQRCAALANANVAVIPSRRIASMMRQYLSGRIGASSPVRTRVLTVPAVPPIIARMSNVSADQWESAITGQLVESRLHRRAHVGVHLILIWVGAELLSDVDHR